MYFQLLCIIVEKEEDIAKFKDFVDTEGPAKTPTAAPAKPAPTSAPPAAKAPPASASQPIVQQSGGVGGRMFASPLARRLAAEQGIDLSQLGSGSGPGGRIRAQDLAGASQGGFQDGGFADIPLTGMRKAIAKRLTESKQTIPHYYLTVDIEIDDILRLVL